MNNDKTWPVFLREKITRSFLKLKIKSTWFPHECCLTAAPKPKGLTSFFSFGSRPHALSPAISFHEMGPLCVSPFLIDVDGA